MRLSLLAFVWIVASERAASTAGGGERAAQAGERAQQRVAAVSALLCAAAPGESTLTPARLAGVLAIAAGLRVGGGASTPAPEPAPAVP